MSENLHEDVAFDPAFDLGVDALHVRAPDELMMEREECESPPGHEVTLLRARALMSMVTAVTWEALSVETIRDRLAVVTALRAADLFPKDGVWHGRVEFQRARSALATCPEIVWERDAGRVMIELLTQRGWGAREVGLHALCLVYAFQPDAALRPRIAGSLECIGEAIGLAAANKRSAVSAAVKRLVTDLVHRMQRCERKRGNGEFWFNKRSGCREALRVAMKGKRNRSAKADGRRVA